MFVAVSPIQAEIYKWTDSNGNVYFSDKPQPGAEEIVLPKVQTYSTPKQVIEPTVPEQPTKIENVPYKKVDIVYPEDQSTIRNPQGAVSVRLELNPKLRKGDRLQLIFDGSPSGAPLPTTVFALQRMHRGSHTLAAEVIDSKGLVLNTSNTITIYMMPPRVGMGNGSP